MNVLDGIKNFLQFINDNWTTILVILGLCVALYEKIKSWLKLSNEKKVEIAKVQIKERILKLISDAEENYQEWFSAGAIKRSEVISNIYEEYPVLSKAVSQEDLIKWIDEQIEAALPTLREIWEKKKEEHH